MTMNIKSLILTFIIVVGLAKAELTGFIVGGKYSKIKHFPYAVFLHIVNADWDACCGASILNQAILLTTAQCLHLCNGQKCILTAYAGSKRRYIGSKRNIIDYKTHEDFDEKSKNNDIALLLLQTDLKLGENVKRIIVMKNPPKYRYGKVAGWGFATASANGSAGWYSLVLKHGKQRILNRTTCLTIKNMPEGTFCVKDDSFPMHGDSGSALVVRKRTIQIGMVSYLIMVSNKITTVYTNVSYHYDWILDNARDLYCKMKTLHQEKEDDGLRTESKYCSECRFWF